MATIYDHKVGAWGKLYKDAVAGVRMRVYLCKIGNPCDVDCQNCCSVNRNPTQEITDIDIDLKDENIFSNLREGLLFIKTNKDGREVPFRIGGTRIIHLTSAESFEEIGIFFSAQKDKCIAPNQSLCFEIQLNEIKLNY